MAEASGRGRISRVRGSARSRRRVRHWLLRGAAVLLLALAALGVDLFVRYLPAVNALRDGQTIAAQLRDMLRAGAGGLDSDRLDQIDSLLTRAAADFGPNSQVLETSWLVGIGGHLPFLGDQFTAIRALRATGEASTQLGLDLLAVLRQALPPAGAPHGEALARLTRIAETDGRALDRVVGDLDALDRAAAQIPVSAHLVGPLASGRASMQSLVPLLDSSVRPAISLMRVLPAAGGPGTHRYLLLLGNPGEQRPGGGFIGAIGEVTLSQGVVTTRTFQSSEFANALVKSIPAPRPLDETLFHGHPWELSDSNWSPDFPTSAAAAARFYQLATAHAVDGVIGVDPVALGYVLAVVGPVSAPPYPQVISSDNTLLLLNEIINKARPSDPGKAYLAPFGAAVLDRVAAAPLAQDAALAGALLRGAKERHIVLSFNDPALMAKADAAGFSGRVSNPTSDAVEIVDANVGGNKADLVVTRSFDLAAAIGSDGQVTDTLTLTYHNPGATDPALASLVAQYNGEYRDYLRVYVPETASLLSLSAQEGPGARSVSPESVDFELHREAIGYLLVVPAGRTVTLTLVYAGPFVDTSVSPELYTLAWSKEIGAPAWPVTVSVSAGPRRSRFSGALGIDRSWSVAAG